MEDARAYEELRVGFTAAVSHELRTPLARLLALLESASLPDADRDTLLAKAREEIRDRLADSAERADVSIRIDAAPEIELPLRRRMLQIVVENLAENSIRYA